MPHSMQAKHAHLTILYGSQTGNAQDVAERIAREGKRRWFTTSVLPMDSYQRANLPHERYVIFVASTTGQGDPPDNMRNFWLFLRRKGLPSDALSGVNFTVFGLGDSSYKKFNFVARWLYKRLKEGLGATCFYPPGFGNEQDALGIDEVLMPWLEGLWKTLLERFPLPPGFDIISDTVLPPPRFRLVCVHPNSDTTTHVPSLPDPSRNSGEWGPSRPYFARVIANRRLTLPEHDQDVRHLEFDLGDSGLTYAAGDVVNILPENPPDAVALFFEWTGLDPTALVRIVPNEQDAVVPANVPQPIRVEELVRQFLDICRKPRRYFFELLRFFARDPQQRERLEYFSSAAGQSDRVDYIEPDAKPVGEVIRDFPSCRPLPLDYLLDLVPWLMPRQFSISSSPAANPGRVHVTAALVEYKIPHPPLIRRGVCSAYFARLDPSKDVRVPLWITRGLLRLPPPHVPMVMVGPGTGLAPFRAFVEERYHYYHRQATSSQPIGEMALFYGCRYRARDWLYERQFTEMAATPTFPLHYHVAFSRDQPHKVYVTHTLRENARLVYEILTRRNGYFFLAGASGSMPADVHDALRAIFQQEGGLTEAEAEAALKELERKRRYVYETWS